MRLSLWHAWAKCKVHRPPTRIHTLVGYARTYIVLPSTIYGVATGPLVDLGIQNPRSQQIPRLVGASIARKRAGMVGLGLNKWPNVHIDDSAFASFCPPFYCHWAHKTIPLVVGDLYMVLYNAILDNRAGHGRDGLYFGENGEHTLRAISERIGEALVELGVSSPDARTPTSFDKRDYARAGNERVRPPHCCWPCLTMHGFCSCWPSVQTRGVERIGRVGWVGNPDI